MKFKGKTTNDMKPFNELMRRLHNLDDNHVEYGYDGTPHHSGKTLAEIAAIHEYGMLGNPERDFMHQTYINMQLENTNRIMQNAEEYLYYGGNYVSLLTNIGTMGTDMIVDTINGGNFVENSPMTIALKGSNKPLIDTGDLQHGAKKWVIKEPIK